MRNIKFILGQISQPRCLKRIESFVEAGYPSMVYGFDNGLYNENVKDKSYPIISWKVNSKKNKLFLLIDKIKYLSMVARSCRKNDIIYIFGFDNAFLMKLLKYKCSYIYEEADLNYTKYSNVLLVKIFREIDKYLIKKSLFTILTSQGFVNYLYGMRQCPENILLINNKLNIYFKNKVRNISLLDSIHQLRFGFIGAIRYPNTIIKFAETIGRRFINHEFHFWGGGFFQELAQKCAKEFSNVFFHDSFRNPEDLQEIYSMIDINVVCYDCQYTNVKIAEPNKLYESIFFGKPILVSRGTFLERRVKDLKIGFSVDALDEESICQFIDSLTLSGLNECISNCMQVPSEELIDNPDVLLNKYCRVVN